MEDKIFDLMEKMYIEFKGGFNKVDQRLEGLENRMTKLEIKIENDISRKIDGLYESRDMTNERLERIENKIDILADKVDKHDLQIQVIEGGKMKKA